MSSKIGEGSTFTLHIPINVGKTQDKQHSLHLQQQIQQLTCQSSIKLEAQVSDRKTAMLCAQKDIDALAVAIAAFDSKSIKLAKTLEKELADQACYSDPLTQLINALNDYDFELAQIQFAKAFI